MRNGQQLVYAPWLWFHPIHLEIQNFFLSRHWREPVIGLHFPMLLIFLLDLFIWDCLFNQIKQANLKTRAIPCLQHLLFLVQVPNYVPHSYPASVTLIERWCMTYWSSELTGCQESLQMVRIMRSRSMGVYLCIVGVVEIYIERTI